MQKQPEPEQVDTQAARLPDEPSDEAKVNDSGPGSRQRLHEDSSPPAHDRRQFSVFQVDDFTFQPTTPRTTHWSVPWSDLMMTMFLLFLIMFVYQTKNKELLVNEHTAVVGGETAKAVEMAPAGKPSIPYVPIKPSLPLITAGTIKKVVPIHIGDIDADKVFIPGNRQNPMERIQKSIAPPPTGQGQQIPTQASRTTTISPQETGLLSTRENVKPLPRPAGEVTTSKNEKIIRLLGRIGSTIVRYHLDRYASVDLLSGDKIRIILTADLFFHTGKADLTPNSMKPLQEIGEAIKRAPFVITVAGHTDTVPTHSKTFPSNWELSVARASSIARFFIEETEMNPNQFEVSGFSSYRPLYPDTTAQNRAANRRVEVLIGTTYPQPEQADTKGEMKQ